MPSWPCSASAAMAAVCQGDEPLRVSRAGRLCRESRAGRRLQGPHAPLSAQKAGRVAEGIPSDPRLSSGAGRREPLVRDPVDLAFDENGRLYVAEMITYSEDPASRRAGRVSLLEDTDGDGRFDKSTIFVDQLEWPTG